MGIIKLYLEPTFTCNLKCKFCYVGEMQEPSNSKSHIFYDKNDSEIFKTLDSFFIEGKEYVYNIDFLGGEPTLDKNLSKIVKYICSTYSTKKVTLTSNGTVYKKTDIEMLKKVGITEFRISLHGGEQIHNFLVGVPVYQKVIKTLQSFKELQIPYTLIYVVNKKNYKEICNLFDELKIQNILPQGVFFEFVEFSGYAHQYIDELALEYTRENVEILNVQFDKITKKYPNIGLVFTNYPQCVLPKKFHEKIDDSVSATRRYEMYYPGGVRKSFFGFSYQEQRNLIKQNFKQGFKINFQQQLDNDFIPQGCEKCQYKQSCYLLIKETILHEYLGQEFLKRKQYFEIFKKKQPGR